MRRWTRGESNPGLLCATQVLALQATSPYGRDMEDAMLGLLAVVVILALAAAIGRDD